jgi:hypothetical protein
MIRLAHCIPRIQKYRLKQHINSRTFCHLKVNTQLLRAQTTFEVVWCKNISSAGRKLRLRPQFAINYGLPPCNAGPIFRQPQLEEGAGSAGKKRENIQRVRGAS